MKEVIVMGKGISIVTFIMGIVTTLSGIAVTVFALVAMARKSYYYR